MRYTISIIVSGVALCAAISSASTRFLRHGDVALEDQPPQNKNSDDPKFLGGSNDGDTDRWQVALRHRRSLWTAIVKHVTSVIENQQMKPLLVEGISDAEEFSKKINGKIKPANVMLQEGASKGENGDLENTVADEDEAESKKVVKKDYEILLDKANELFELNLEASKQNMHILDEITDPYMFESLEQNEEVMLYRVGLNAVKAQKQLAKFFKLRPHQKEHTLQLIQRIKNMRQDIEKRERVLKKEFDDIDKTNIPQKKKELIPMILDDIKEENDRWLYPEREVDLEALYPSPPESIEGRFLSPTLYP